MVSINEYLIGRNTRKKYKITDLKMSDSVLVLNHKINHEDKALLYFSWPLEIYDNKFTLDDDTEYVYDMSQYHEDYETAYKETDHYILHILTMEQALSLFEKYYENNCDIDIIPGVRLDPEDFDMKHIEKTIDIIKHKL